MENHSSHPHPKTWERSDESCLLSSNRTSLSSRQSSRENNISIIFSATLYVPPCGLNLIIPEQNGFRPNLSTSHQLLSVVEAIRSGFRKQKSTGAVFLDIQKAFDRVWRERL
ncbi:hypothetical protein TNCV_680161 [Trichonephila clavipes]|nr:hypothetical protein TNCV_680161 [Trichonephila clavipes]